MRARLRRANEAELRKANLRLGYLQGAQLRGADLREANLQKAELQNADLCSWSIDLHFGLERYITDFCIGPGLHSHLLRQFPQCFVPELNRVRPRRDTGNLK